MSKGKFIAKLSRSSLEFLKKTHNILDAVLSGFWLGVLSKKNIDNYTELHYNRSAKYTTDSFNLSGLHQWERNMIQKHFSGAKTILLIGAGGGRETLALSKIGFKVDSYECNPEIIEYGNRFVKNNGLNAGIKYLPVNSVPAEIKKYDGIIIGWSSYSHIQGNRSRILFLSKLFPFLSKESPLMISFLTKEEKGRQEKIIKNVSNFFRSFTRKDKTESGDRLMSYFAHFFNEEEIRNELAQANLKLIEYYNIDYGCVIARI